MGPGGVLALWCAWSLSRSIVHPLGEAKGGEVVTQVVASMGRIAGSSKKKTDIIGEISTAVSFKLAG
jgi:hypothetical protein